jgi:hypothetical protein
MKKLALCLILFLVSVPLSAGILGLSAGITGGVEMWDPNTEGSETQTFTGIGLTATISPPFIPINIRGDLEYAWKSYTDEDVKISDIFILLGLERSIAPPLSPLSLYLGLGGEMSILDNGDGESMTDYGFLIYGGINLNVGLMAVFAETGYGMIFMDRGNLTHIPIRGGIKVSL